MREGTRRVVVTGLGAITPIGNSVEEFWQGIKDEKIGFAPITYFDTADYRCKLAAEVKDFDATQYMDKKAARRMEQFCQFAVAAAGEAIKDAELDMEKEDAFRVGCSVGSGIGSLQAMEREHDRLTQKGPSRVSPMLVPLMISNMAAGQPAYIELFTAEFKVLTKIGNEYRIRHHETDKIEIMDLRFYDYFFNRCLSLLALAIQYLQ